MFITRPSSRCINDIVLEDIWQTIFSIVQQEELKECLLQLHDPHPDGTVTPMPRQAFVLSQVCRHWRSIAISQPTLWRDIFLWLRVKSPYSLLDMCLKRTGDADLNITIMAYSLDIDHSVDDDEFWLCLHLLNSVSHRWRSVSFTLGKAAMREIRNILFPRRNFNMGIIMEIEQNPQPENPWRFPRLESISFGRYIPSKTGYEHMDKDIYAFVGRFCDAVDVSPPILCFGGLNTVMLPKMAFIQQRLRLQSVVSLTLVRHHIAPEFEAFVDVLSTLPLLKILELRQFGCWPSREERYPQQRIQRRTLRHLEKLSVLDMTHNAQVEVVFRYLLLPSLTDVTFTPPLHTSSFRETIELSQCRIRRFNMKAKNIFHDYIFYFLSATAFAHLEELTLEADDLPTRQIEFLDLERRVFDIPKMDKQVLTPVFRDTLQSLTLLGCSSDDGTLGQVAEARMKKGGLKHFYARVSGKNKDARNKDREIFGSLRRSGFDAYLDM